VSRKLDRDDLVPARTDTTVALHTDTAPELTEGAPEDTAGLELGVEEPSSSPARRPRARRRYAGGPGALLEPLPRTRPVVHLAALGTYLAVAVAVWAHVWLGGDPAHTITCNCGDSSQQVWWLEWLPWALGHGHNPLLTNTLWARFGGVNVLSNTSWLAPAALLAPVTLLFGPVASFNAANLLAPVVSGWAAFALAGHVSRRAGARIVAGGLYAFSPFVLRNTVLGHIDLTIAPYLPVMMLLGLGLLRRGARPVRTGVLLGLLTVLQFFTGFEVLAISAITGVMFVGLVMLLRPDVVAAARGQIVRAVALATTISAAVLAYPVWYFLAGPRHVDGPFWAVVSSSPQAIAWPGPDVFNTHTPLAQIGYLGPQGPNTDYLGIGLLAFVALSVGVWRHSRSCRVVAVVGAACWVLEFLPGVLWARIPLVSSIQLIRFAMPVSLCVGIVLCVSIDGWWRRAATWAAATGGTHRRRWARGAVVGAVMVAFVPLVVTYSVPFRVTNATVPAWFTRDAGRLPRGTAVVTVPFAYGIASAPMAWQAEVGDSFDLVGGWVFVPGGNGTNAETVSPMGGAPAALLALGDDPAAVTASQQESIRGALVRLRPLVVVVVPRAATPGTVEALTDTLGIAPTWSDGAWVWHLTASSALGPRTPVNEGRVGG
jgi:hypothetical protein